MLQVVGGPQALLPDYPDLAAHYQASNMAKVGLIKVYLALPAELTCGSTYDSTVQTLHSVMPNSRDPTSTQHAVPTICSHVSSNWASPKCSSLSGYIHASTDPPFFCTAVDGGQSGG